MTAFRRRPASACTLRLRRFNRSIGLLAYHGISRSSCVCLQNVDFAGFNNLALRPQPAELTRRISINAIAWYTTTLLLWGIVMRRDVCMAKLSIATKSTIYVTVVAQWYARSCPAPYHRVLKGTVIKHFVRLVFLFAESSCITRLVLLSVQV